MPEGHTLRRLADDLTRAFAGGVVRVSSPQGRFAAAAQLLDATTLVGADSSGKRLFVEFEGERIVNVHLGLIGKFDVRSGPAPLPVGQVRLRLTTESGPPAYADLRGATVCRLITPVERDGILGR